ncbi:MAG: hypothetical protein MZV65_40590 [Chromatiales bacterium]|nr:hypothetical protein [Chromatiales bacterium]
MTTTAANGCAKWVCMRRPGSGRWCPWTGPPRLRVELSEWGDNNASLEPGFILFDTKGRGIEADRVTAW